METAEKLPMNVESAGLAKYVGESMASGMVKAFTRTASYDKLKMELGFLYQQFRKNPKLLQVSDKASIGEAFCNVAACNTTLNPAVGHAWLIPRDGKCCLDFSYRGLCDQITRGGNVQVINATVVYDCDDFDMEEGTAKYIKHRPLASKIHPSGDEIGILEDLAVSPWKHIVGAYSIATLATGHQDFVFLPRWKIEKAKAASKYGSVWTKYPEEQTRKTVLRYHTKTLPLNPSAAIAVSMTHDIDGIDMDTQESRPSKDLGAAFTVED